MVYDGLYSLLLLYVYVCVRKTVIYHNQSSVNLEINIIEAQIVICFLMDKSSFSKMQS